MEAKNRILTQREFERAEESAEWENDYDPILKAQDEKSFKAGMVSMLREVVEKSEELLLPSVCDGSPKRLEWQAFKESKLREV